MRLKVLVEIQEWLILYLHGVFCIALRRSTNGRLLHWSITVAAGGTSIIAQVSRSVPSLRLHVGIPVPDNGLCCVRSPGKIRSGTDVGTFSEGSLYGIELP